MMKQNRIIALAAVALALAISTPAQAQFGNLLNRAKKAVKEKVEKEADKAADKVTSTAKDKAGKVAQDVTGKARAPSAKFTLPTNILTRSSSPCSPTGSIPRSI